MTEAETKAATKKRLEEMLAKLADAKKVAEKDLTGHDPRTVAGMITRQREAKEEVKSLTDAYKALIQKSVVKVFVTGPRAAEFSKVASEDGVVVVDGSKMYVEFAKVVEPSMGNSRQFTQAQVFLLIKVLQRWMEENVVRSIESPKVPVGLQDSEAKTFEDLVDRVRIAIENTNGTKLLQKDLETIILNAALAQKATSTILPTLITGLTSKEIESLSQTLFPQWGSVAVQADETKTNEELIEQINTAIRKLFGKQ